MHTNRLVAAAALFAHGLASARNMDWIYEDGGGGELSLSAVALMVYMSDHQKLAALAANFPDQSKP